MTIDSNVFIADGAKVLGNVTIKEGSSVWYNAIIRGDMEPVTIGKNTNIQDLVMVHVDSSHPTVIGDGVTVGHSAILHGCTIEDDVIIGMGAIVLNGAVIKKNSIVGAGALITQNKTFPEGSLILGSPAKVVRQLTTGEIDKIRHNDEEYLVLAKKLGAGR